jgi:hypothetical protein
MVEKEGGVVAMAKFSFEDLEIWQKAVEFARIAFVSLKVIGRALDVHVWRIPDLC